MGLFLNCIISFVNRKYFFTKIIMLKNLTKAVRDKALYFTAIVILVKRVVLESIFIHVYENALSLLIEAFVCLYIQGGPKKSL